MTIQPRNIFIVQTAENTQNGRPRGSQISLINKQSALYKYRQQRKQKEERTSPGQSQRPPSRNLDTHRSSWLLESRPLQPSHPSDNSVIDDREFPSDDHGNQLALPRHGDESFDLVWDRTLPEDAQLHNCYAGLRTDPFCCMPIENSSVVLGVSDLYTNMMIPHVSHLAKIFNVQNVYLDIFWQMIFQEDTIDAVVTMSYCVDANWRKSSGFVPKQDLFLHHGRSLARLRRRLSDTDTAATGITLSILMYNTNIAKSLGNTQAAKQHMSMMRHLLRKNPGLESLGYQGKLKFLLSQWDYFLNLNSDEGMLLPTETLYESEYPPSPLNDEMSHIVRTLPTGFQGLAEKGQLSCQVLRVLGRMQEMVAAAAAGSIEAFLIAPNKNPYPDFCAAIPCLNASNGSESSLERLIACTIFLLTSRLLNPLKKTVWSLPVLGGRTILTQQVFNCKVESDAEKYCLIWVCLIGIDSWGATGGPLPESGQQLMQQLRTRYPETSRWSSLPPVAKNYFWTNELEVSCKRYWAAEQ